MLYPVLEQQPDEEQHYITIDYQRAAIPLTPTDVIIPHFPETGDMVVVSGEGNELWLAHIQSVDVRNHTCQVNFYIEDGSSAARYKKESSKLEKLHWESIVSSVNGKWSGSYWIIS